MADANTSRRQPLSTEGLGCALAVLVGAGAIGAGLIDLALTGLLGRPVYTRHVWREVRIGAVVLGLWWVALVAAVVLNHRRAIAHRWQLALLVAAVLWVGCLLEYASWADSQDRLRGMWNDPPITTARPSSVPAP